MVQLQSILKTCKGVLLCLYNYWSIYIVSLKNLFALQIPELESFETDMMKQIYVNFALNTQDLIDFGLQKQKLIKRSVN